MAHHKPDFVGIGMPNCGTRWLYDQLAGHREVWMPCVKELHFFDRGMRSAPAEHALEKYLRVRRNPLLYPWIRVLPRYADFDQQLAFLQSYLHGERSAHRSTIEARIRPLLERDSDWKPSNIPNPGLNDEDFCAYEQYFASDRNATLGEITPRYCELESAYIEEILEAFPNLKFILNIRAPGELLLSRLKKRLRKGKRTVADLEDFLAKRANGDSVRRYAARTLAIIDKWTSLLDSSRLHIVPMEHIRQDPASARAAVARFLGIGSEPESFKRPANFNRKQRNSGETRLDGELESKLEALITAGCAEAEQAYRSRMSAD